MIKVKEKKDHKHPSETETALNAYEAESLLCLCGASVSVVTEGGAAAPPQRLLSRAIVRKATERSDTDCQPFQIFNLAQLQNSLNFTIVRTEGGI